MYTYVTEGYSMESEADDNLCARNYLDATQYSGVESRSDERVRHRIWARRSVAPSDLDGRARGRCHGAQGVRAVASLSIERPRRVQFERREDCPDG